MGDIKIGFIASSGGHFEQLMMLKPLMEKYSSFLVTEKTLYEVKEVTKTYYVDQINRKELLFIPKFIANFLKAFSILMKEKPDVVISTGALATVPTCLLTKLMGKKLIYIESFAKVTSPTISGKMLYKHADKFFVQWEQMLEIYPDATYCGGIY